MPSGIVQTHWLAIRTVGLILLFLWCWAPVGAQQPSLDSNQLRKDLLDAITTKDPNRIREELERVRATRSFLLIADIRKHEQTLGKLGLTRQAQEVLAELYKTRYLQVVLCQVESQDPQVRLDEIRKLKLIGGWFSIQVLVSQFDADKRWKDTGQKYWKKVPKDVVLTPPSNLALSILSR